MQYQLEPEDVQNSDVLDLPEDDKPPPVQSDFDTQRRPEAPQPSRLIDPALMVDHPQLNAAPERSRYDRRANRSLADVNSSFTPPYYEDGNINTDVVSPSPIVTRGMLALIDAFFDTLYPLPCFAFLHPPTTKRRCQEGQMHRALASAICAVVSLYHPQRGNSEQRDVGFEWIQASEQSIWMHLECPTIPRLQTLLLIIYHRMETGRFQRAFMLLATAARFASAMRLNYERPELADPVGREVRRRIVWSLKIMERYFCVGLPEFELCPIEVIYIDFPTSEEEFGTDRPGELGAYSLQIRLEVVRRDIMKLTRSLSHLEQPIPSLLELIQHHANTLADVGASMPNGTSLATAEIVDLVNQPWLPRRLLMHISWHQANCDLNRILLPGYPEAAPSAVLNDVGAERITEAERQSLSHAMSIIQILTALNQESSSNHLLEFDTAICAYHATRLLLFISRFGKQHNRPSPEFAASRAELCIAALKRFFPSSLLVAPIIEELQYSLGIFSQQQQQAILTSQYVMPTADAPSRTSPHQLEHLAPEAQAEPETAARARQKLAIHSLLRQAEFSEDDQEKISHADMVSAEELGRGVIGAEAQAESTENTGQRGAGKDPDVAEGVILNPSALPTPRGIDNSFGPITGAWDMGTSLPVGLVMEGTGDLDLPLFAWAGSQDWDWLFEPQT